MGAQGTLSLCYHGSLTPIAKCGAPAGGEQPDGDLRQLEFKKNQYGPIGETIVLRYQHGLFLPERGISNLDKLAREANVDDALLAGLQALFGPSRPRNGRADFRHQ